MRTRKGRPKGGESVLSAVLNARKMNIPDSISAVKLAVTAA
jgi:hypothetical protein